MPTTRLDDLHYRRLVGDARSRVPIGVPSTPLAARGGAEETYQTDAGDEEGWSGQISRRTGNLRAKRQPIMETKRRWSNELCQRTFVTSFCITTRRSGVVGMIRHHGLRAVAF